MLFPKSKNQSKNKIAEEVFVSNEEIEVELLLLNYNHKNEK
jgi:hypothetical protein